jgi:hypothetical protein
MPRYINEEVLLKRLSKVIEQYRKEDAGDTLRKINDAVIGCPSTDVVEVRHGFWDIRFSKRVDHLGEFFKYEGDFCSICGAMGSGKYCSACGARMDGEKMKGGEG